MRAIGDLPLTSFSGVTTVTSNGGERPLEYGDIAILLRSANTVGGVYRRVLGEHGIPVSSVQGGGFFESVEVSTLISMLAVIDNPHKDIPLIAVLRSPSLSFSPDELSDIRSADKKADLYTALLETLAELLANPALREMYNLPGRAAAGCRAQIAPLLQMCERNAHLPLVTALLTERCRR